MKLIGFEWKKIWSGKIIWIFLAFFCLNLGIYYVYMIPNMPTKEENKIRQEWELYLEEHAGGLEEKHRLLQEEQTKTHPMTESQVLYDLSNEYASVLEYQKFIQGLKERAEEMNQFSIFNQDNGYSQRNITKTVEDFSRVEQLEIDPTPDTGMKALHNFYLTDIFLLLLVCLFCMQVFGNDFKSGMGNLVQITPKGKGWLRMAQIQAIALAVIVSAVLMYGTNIWMGSICVGFGESSKYIQGMTMFRNVSFPCTIGRYLFYFVTWKVAALLLVTFVVAFLAIRLNGTNLTWILTGAVFALSFVMWFYIPDTPFVKLFRYLNPIGILDVKQIIGNYQNLKVGEYPVSLLLAAIVFIVMGSFICVFGALLVNKSTHTHKTFPVFQLRKSRLWKRLFSYEVYKNVLYQKSALVFIALILVSALTIKPWNPHVNYETYCYENYIREYAGAYSEKKVEEIREFGENGNSEEVQMIYEQAMYLEQSEAENKGFVNLRIYREFFVNEQIEYQNTLYIVIAVLLSVSGLFYYDKKQQMETLLRSTSKYISVFYSKVGFAMLAGGVSSILVWGITYVKFFLHYPKLEGFSYAIQSIPEFSAMKMNLSIMSYLICTMLLRVMVGIYLGIIMSLLVQILSVPTQNIICTVLCFIMPLCLCYIGQMQYENALIHFIRDYLEPMLAPVKYLSSLQAVWIEAGWIWLVIFLSIPCASICVEKKIWNQI